MKATALVLLSFLLILAVLAASWAARMETETDGTFAVAASKGRVALGIGREVLITDDEGVLIGAARGADGKPWTFGDIASVAFDDELHVYVCDLKRSQVVEFDSDGANGRLLPLQKLPALSFEVLPLDDLYVADTMGHHLRRYARSGEQRDSKRVRYPNGISVAATPKGPLLVMAETGAVRASVWTPELEPAEWAPATALNLYLKKSPFRELLELTVTPAGELIAANCRSTSAECTIVRVSADATKIERIADSLTFKSPVPDAVDGILGTGELAVTPGGALLVAMPRAAAVLKFSAPGGRLAGDYCTSCSDDELKAGTVDIASLAQPLSWPNGTLVSLFGDASVQARYATQRQAWARFAAIEAFARYGTYGIATALLVALFLARQSGAGEAGGKRLQTIVRELVAPEWRALGSAVAVIALAVAAAGAAGFAWLGGAGFLVAGVPAGLIVSRWVSPRLLLALRSDNAAARAHTLFLADSAHGIIEPGETLEWARFAMPMRPLRADLSAADSASKADDLIDALELLAPRLILLARTNRRLLAVETSMIGALLGPVLDLAIADPLSPTGTLDVVAAHFARRWRIGPGAAQRAHAESARFRCEKCGQHLGACKHSELGLAVPLMASFLFPGIGALVRGEFGRARLNAVVGLGFLSQAAKEYFPQSFGTLSWKPALWLVPLYGYAGALLIGAGAVIAAWMKDRRRAAIR